MESGRNKVKDLCRTPKRSRLVSDQLETVYNDRQQVLTVSSYDAAASGSIVNQLLYVYDGYGRVLREYQSHAGAVTL